MKAIILSIFSLLCASYCYSTTTVPGGTILTDHWTVQGTPYLIQGDLEIVNSLNIDPGVEIIFMGHYGIRVHGTLRAIGSSDDRIIFRANDTTNWHIDSIPQGGWKGIYYDQYNHTWTDSSQLEFCDIQDVKFGASSHTAASYYNYTLYSSDRDFKILDCNFFHNQSATTNHSHGVIVQIYQYNNKKTEIARCNFYDNITWLGVIYLSQWNQPHYQTLYHVHHNKFHDNLGATSSVYGLHTEMLYEYNEVYHNTCDDRGAHGSGLKLLGGRNTVQLNKFHHNTLHSNASMAFNAGKATIQKNFIHNNYMGASGSLCGISGGGAGIHMAHNLNVPRDSTKFIVRDNIIANNQANFAGAGIHIVQGNVEIYNNHILNNKSNARGSAISALGMQYAKVKINNNIFWNNGFPNIQSIRVACDTFSFDYNLIDYSYSSSMHVIAGTLSGDTVHNIIGQNPNLINPTTTNGYLTDATNSNFQLMHNSPCIEHGNASGFNLHPTDYYGGNRVQGNFIDIGAHESENTTPNSIDEVLEDAFMISPNPVSIGSLITIKLTSFEKADLQITTIQGKVLKRIKLDNGVNYLDTQLFSSGIYLMKLQSGNKSYTQKLLVN